jgi:hypothetical protein
MRQSVQLLAAALLLVRDCCIRHSQH